MAAHDSHGPSGHSEAAHHAGPGRYAAILGILIALTVVTVVTGKMDLGGLNLPLAMAIAVTKATLVVLFFMHMLEAEIMNKIVFVSSIFFLALLLLGSWGDIATRWKPGIPAAGERSAPLVVPPGHGHGGGHAVHAPAPEHE